MHCSNAGRKPSHFGLFRYLVGDADKRVNDTALVHDEYGRQPLHTERGHQITILISVELGYTKLSTSAEDDLLQNGC